MWFRLVFELDVMDFWNLFAPRPHTVLTLRFSYALTSFLQRNIGFALINLKVEIKMCVLCANVEMV